MAARVDEHLERRRGAAGRAVALRAYIAEAGSPNGYGWPGEGTQLWTKGQVMMMNYITGSSYLLNWGIPTLGKCDINRMRNEAISFTQMMLDLCAASRSSLSALDLAPL